MTSTRWRRVAIACLSLAATLLPASASAGNAIWVGRYSVPVDGEVAGGWLAYPTRTAPRTLLVYGHPCCGKPDQSLLVGAFANTHNSVAVAMDYRGPGRWDVLKGSRDLVAATADLKRRFPTITRTVIWGMSMGGETTGLAVAQNPRLFDYWVSVFGVSHLSEEFLALGGSPSLLASWIVQETGGHPVTHQREYDRRSPAVLTDRMRGLKRAYLLHGTGDMLVPYTQSRQLFENLRRSGVPVSLYTFVSGRGGFQGGNGAVGFWTLPTGYGPAAHDDRGGAAFAVSLVDRLLAGQVPDNRGPAWEHVVDHTTRTGT